MFSAVCAKKAKESQRKAKESQRKAKEKPKKKQESISTYVPKTHKKAWAKLDRLRYSQTIPRISCEYIGCETVRNRLGLQADAVEGCSICA